MPPVDLFDFVPLSVAGDRAGRKRLTTLYPHDRRGASRYATSLVGIADTRSGSMVSEHVHAARKKCLTGLTALPSGQRPVHLALASWVETEPSTARR